MSADAPPADAPRGDRVDSLVAAVARFYPGRDTTAKSVVWRLRHAAHHLDTEVRRRLVPLGMELWELEILSALIRGDGALTMGKLLDVAQVTSGAITNRVGQLERKGYVRRDIDPADRRQILVTLTESGTERAELVLDANNAAEAEIFADIDAALLTRLSKDLREFLLATEGPDPHGV